MSVPTPNTALAGHSMAYPPAQMALLDAVFGAETPKPVARPRKERSTPVRNPAFREHEGLKALQRQLNSKNK